MVCFKSVSQETQAAMAELLVSVRSNDMITLVYNHSDRFKLKDNSKTHTLIIATSVIT
jgi:hypothetical protein